MRRVMMLLAGIAAGLWADEVRIEDGTLLKGTIRSISETQIELETQFAGTLQIDRSQVTAFSTDNPLFVRLSGGTVIPGEVSTDREGQVNISGEDGSLEASLASVKQAWVEPGQDPEILAREKALAEMERRWHYRAAATVSGKSGNTDEKNMGFRASATLAGKHDELKFYGSYERKESEGEKTTDERKAGMRYTSYFHEPWGWYIRQEFENDEFENIQLRSLTAGGVSYRFFNEEDSKLSANAGLSYRYETYDDNSPDDENIGLDIGLQHFYRMKNRFEISNELTYVPSIEDFASYLLTQDSAIDFPLGDSRFWKVRLGLRNDYNSQPEGGRNKLDTTYYSSLVAEWD